MDESLFAALHVICSAVFLQKRRSLLKSFVYQLNRQRNRYWFLLVLTLCLLLFPTSGHASEETLNFHVTPELPESQVENSTSYFDLNLEAGKTETLALKLQNAGSEIIQVQITPHTAYTNVHGVVEYGKNSPEPDPTLLYSLADLIEPSEVIELMENEIKTVEVSLQMPDETFAGFLAGGLRIAEVNEAQEEETSNEEGVAIKNEFAYVVGVVVSNSRNSIQSDLELVDVFADQLNYRNVISANLQNFTPTFVNRLEIEATVQKEGEDEILYEATQNQMQMAPNSNFNFPISLEGDRFRSGEYVLKMTARSGEEEWNWSKQFTIETDEARKLNRADVMVDTRTNWWKLGSIILILLLLGLVLLILYQKKKTSETQKKE